MLNCDVDQDLLRRIASALDDLEFELWYSSDNLKYLQVMLSDFFDCKKKYITIEKDENKSAVIKFWIGDGFYHFVVMKLESLSPGEKEYFVEIGRADHVDFEDYNICWGVDLETALSIMWGCASVMQLADIKPTI